MENRQKSYSLILTGLEEEHNRTLHRRILIEKIKEIREAQEAVELKKHEVLENQRQKLLADKQKETLLKTAEIREQKRIQQQQKDLEKKQAIAIATKIVTATKDGKLTKNDQDQLDKDPNQFVQEQMKQIASEREKLEQKIS